MNPMKYRPAWRFPGGTESFIRGLCRGFTVHVMNGMSKLGNVRIDMYSHDTDVRADALQLPLKDECADTVVCDPPWNMDYALKPKLMRELTRVLKPGGRLIFNAPWTPKCPGMPVESVHVPEWQLMSFQHLALVFISRKIRRKLPL